ncbi:hypothetical protein [Parasediminibacterium sp. JCM 36343]|uniref:hypothetical protein n=1 Tax=Parasediminibacterium sp. JCM 36343 TaxID=3374279 RepID=UPI00397987FE
MQAYKKIVKQVGKITLCFALAIILHTAAKAQTPADTPGGPGTTGGGGGEGTPDGPVVPLDRNMSVMLLVAGVGYAAIKQKKLVLAS